MTDAFLHTAQTAARKAAIILMDNFGKVRKNDIRKKSKTDFLSFVDEQSEKSIIETIHAEFPGHSILAEESGNSHLEDDYLWIIDPLDGTTNYLSSIPIFAISIAVKHKNEIITGVVYDPVRDEMFYAEKNKGAFMNGEPVKVSDVGDLNESLFATGFPFKEKHILQDYLKAFEEVFFNSIGARRMGAAAIDMCYVAAGKFDAFWEIGLNPWDIAAGEIILKEAGGRITDFWNQPNHLSCSYVIATNGKIHDQLGEIIRKFFPFYKSLSEGRLK